MGKKSGSKILKRTMSPTFWQIERKNKRFVTKPSSGPHPSKLSIPLTVLLRDILKLTKTYAETKIIIGIKENMKEHIVPDIVLLGLILVNFLPPIVLPITNPPISEKIQISKIKIVTFKPAL